MRQTVQFQPKTGTSSTGSTTYGPVQQVKARYVEKMRQIRNASGSEVVSTSEVLMAATPEPKLGDKINGRQVQNRSSIVAKDGTVLAYKAYL